MALNDAIATKATSITTVTVANTLACRVVKFGNSGLSACVFTANAQATVNLSAYLSYVYAAFAQGTVTDNFNTAMITQTDPAHITVDPNRGSTTKYAAWFLVLGISV